MKAICRIVWKATLAPPAWWALLNMFYSAFSAARIWFTGRTVYSIPMIEIMMCIVGYLVMAYFWLNPLPLPPAWIKRPVRTS